MAVDANDSCSDLYDQRHPFADLPLSPPILCNSARVIMIAFPISYKSCVYGHISFASRYTYLRPHPNIEVFFCRSPDLLHE